MHPKEPVTHLRPMRRLREIMLESNPPDPKSGQRFLTSKQQAILREMRNAPRPAIERAIATAKAAA